MDRRVQIKKLIEFIIFIMIIGCVFTGLTWLFRKNIEVVRKDISTFPYQGDLDVVLYGASSVNGFYQPMEAWEQHGFTSFDYAVTASRIDSLVHMIKESRQHCEPGLYVCDIRGINVVVEKIEEPAIRNWSDSLPVFSPERWSGITSYVFSRNWRDVDLVSFYFDLFKYHTNTDALKKSEQWEYLDRKNIKNISKGYHAKKGHIPLERTIMTDDVGELSDYQTRVLTELLDYCDDEKINVLFICSPYQISDEDQKVINATEKLISSRGYDFVDLNKYYDEMGLDFGTDFSDVNHINYFGAKKYTKYLSDYLSKNYDLPDHRGDDGYSRWESDLAEYDDLEKEWDSETRAALESHLEARAKDEELPGVDDFYKWSALFRKDDNYSVIIRIADDPSKRNTYNRAFSDFLKDYGIDTGNDSYLGIFSGKKELVSTVSEPDLKGEIGENAGRGTDSCKISLNDKELLIGDTDSYLDGDIQIVVYDNIYKTVVDNVLINASGDDSSLIERPVQR